MFTILISAQCLVITRNEYQRLWSKICQNVEGFKMSSNERSRTADEISFILLCALTGLLCVAALCCCIYMCWYVREMNTRFINGVLL